LNWQIATVAELVTETPSTRSIALDVPDWARHRAGQHVDLRLTGEDGYQAQRSYSIASAPEDDRVVLTVERLDDGEVSPFLVDELRTGDELELRGPVGGYFVWEAACGGPLLLVAGGSGVVPFRAMLRHHCASGSTAPVRLLYSTRSLGDVIYRDELTRLTENDGIDVRFSRPASSRRAGADTDVGSTRNSWPISPGHRHNDRSFTYAVPRISSRPQRPWSPWDTNPVGSGSNAPRHRVRARRPRRVQPPHPG